MLPHGTTVKPPPPCKMWLVSLLAIYPLVVAFQAALGPAIKTWPLLVRSAAFPLILSNVYRHSGGDTNRSPVARGAGITIAADGALS